MNMTNTAPSEATESLLPCPFCGNQAHPAAQVNHVECRGMSCPIQWEVMTTSEWNTRVNAGRGVLVNRDDLKVLMQAAADHPDWLNDDADVLLARRIEAILQPNG